MNCSYGVYATSGQRPERVLKGARAGPKDGVSGLGFRASGSPKEGCICFFWVVGGEGGGVQTMRVFVH